MCGCLGRKQAGSNMVNLSYEHSFPGHQPQPAGPAFAIRNMDLAERSPLAGPT